MWMIFFPCFSNVLAFRNTERCDCLLQAWILTDSFRRKFSKVRPDFSSSPISLHNDETLERNWFSLSSFVTPNLRLFLRLPISFAISFLSLSSLMMSNVILSMLSRSLSMLDISYLLQVILGPPSVSDQQEQRILASQQQVAHGELHMDHAVLEQSKRLTFWSLYRLSVVSLKLMRLA